MRSRSPPPSPNIDFPGPCSHLQQEQARPDRERRLDQHPRGSGFMSEQAVKDWIRKTVASNDVVLFMKGNKTAPQCGFSAYVVQILGHLGVDYKDVNVLEDLSIREGIK